MWATWVVVALAVAVELLRRFVLSVNSERDALRRDIARLREEMRDYNPQTEYARFVRADRELKRMVAEQQAVDKRPVAWWQQLLGLATYLFVVLHWSVNGPVVSVDSAIMEQCHSVWWWPLSRFVTAPLLVSLAFAWAASRVAAVAVQWSSSNAL